MNSKEEVGEFTSERKVRGVSVMKLVVVILQLEEKVKSRAVMSPRATWSNLIHFENQDAQLYWYLNATCRVSSLVWVENFEQGGRQSDISFPMKRSSKGAKMSRFLKISLLQLPQQCCYNMNFVKFLFTNKVNWTWCYTLYVMKLVFLCNLKAP